MFKKPLAQQSNAAPLKSSARRKLLAEIFVDYPALLGGLNEEKGVSEKDLGKLILPEGIRSGSFENSGGVEGTFWLSPDGDPLWMSFGRNSKEYIPTLYLLSIDTPNPPLPIIQLHNPLPPPLYTGAPLFLPAVRYLNQPHLLPDIPKGSIVAFVTSPENGPEVQYVGVGRVVSEGGMKGAWERRRDNLQSHKDVDEGKFCDILCIYGDHLWELGSKGALSTFIYPTPAKSIFEPPQRPPQPESEAGPSRSQSPTGDLIAPVQAIQIAESSDPKDKTEPLDLHPSEISTLLSLSLLQSLPNIPQSTFPIPASLLYSAHILPNRPAYIPRDQRGSVVIAQSEWKKLGKWMKEAGKEGVIKVKENKGEFIVQGYDAQHPSMQGHVPYHTIAEEELKAAKRAAREAAAQEDIPAGNAKGKGKELVIEEVWKPSGASISFWEAAGVDKGEPQPSSHLKTAFEAYITKHNLIDPTDHRIIHLDTELGRVVGIKKPENQRMLRDDILQKLKTGVTWSVIIDGVPKKGPMQPVLMSVKTRQGRKTITHISGLETFSVDVDEFAEVLRRLCAGSASVGPLPGASPKLGLQEIMVQGSQVKVVTEALIARGIPKRWIKEGEGDKKKK